MRNEQVYFPTIEKVLNLRPIIRSEFRQGKSKRSALPDESGSGVTLWDRHTAHALIFSYVTSVIFLKAFLPKQLLVSILMAPPPGMTYSNWQCLVGDCRPSKRCESLDMSIITQLRKLVGSEPIISSSELKTLSNDLRSHFSRGKSEYWSPNILYPACYLPKHFKTQITKQLQYQEHHIDKLFICPNHFKFPSSPNTKRTFHDFRYVRPYLDLKNFLFLIRCSFFNVQLDLDLPQTSSSQEKSDKVLQFLRSSVSNIPPNSYNPFFVHTPPLTQELYFQDVSKLFASHGLTELVIDLDEQRLSVWSSTENKELFLSLCLLKNTPSVPLPSLCEDDARCCSEYFTKKFKDLVRNTGMISSIIQQCFKEVDPLMTRNLITEGYLSIPTYS